MSEELIQEAHACYRLLQAGRPHDAIARLTAFVETADAADRPDLCARGLAWLGQAHVDIGAFSDARAALRRAAAVATAIGDHAGLQAIRELRQDVGTRAMAASQAAPTHDDSPIGRACAALDAGDLVEGARLAELALEEATTPRDEVLALLALARVPEQAESAVRRAAGVADRSNDFNLVTAVSRAARAANVPLPTKVF